jgi:nucleoside-diphosphate-sugar epimerase
VPPKLTVVGARGFIGSAVTSRAAEWEVRALRHDEIPEGEALGHVVYCSGVAFGADRQPLQAYERHAWALARLLRTCTYERLVYVSSTRVYDGSSGTDETTAACLRSDAPGDVYALSKLAGEGIALAASLENRVVRLSNVYGPSVRSELFLSDILKQAVRTGRISLRSSLESSKDYVSVEDVADSILQIATASRERVYNIAAGTNVTHRSLIEAIRRSAPVDVEVAADAPATLVPAIDTRRLQAEFPFAPRSVVDDLPALVDAFRAALEAESTGG